MHKLILLVVLAVTITGCSSRKDFYAIDGSRADGSIDMAYDFKPFETPIVDINQAESVASSKCAVWGYERAERFGIGQSLRCHASDSWGNCTAGQVVVKFQCIGNITPPTQAAAPTATASSVQIMSATQYKETRLKALMEKNLPYSEYQKQYHAIMAE